MSDSRRYFMSTERLGFGRWQASDLPLAEALWGNPQVTAMIHGPYSPQQIAARLAREIESAERCGLQYWPLFLLAGGEFVGCCGLREHQSGSGYPELGFHLLPQHWGRGLALEAAQCVIGRAFAEPGIAGIYAGHHPENHASRKVLLAAGFSPGPAEYFESTGLLHPSYTLTATGTVS